MAKNVIWMPITESNVQQDIKQNASQDQGSNAYEVAQNPRKVKNHVVESVMYTLIGGLAVSSVHPGSSLIVFQEAQPVI